MLKHIGRPMLPTPTNPTVGSCTVPVPAPFIAKPSPFPAIRPGNRTDISLTRQTRDHYVRTNVECQTLSRFSGVIDHLLWWLEAAAQLDAVGVAFGVVVGDREFDGGFAGIEVEALH